MSERIFVDTNNTEKYYTANQAAQETRISISTITRAIQKKELSAREISSNGNGGHKYMIAESDLIKWLETRKTRKTVIMGVTELSIDDLAAEILKRMKMEYDRGYKDGAKKAKEEFMSAFKGVKL